MTDGEKRAWLRVLRSDQPLSRELRDQIADMLERYFFSTGGRPPDSEWMQANKQLRGIGYRMEIEKEVERMKNNGERPKGGRQARAREIVAERFKAQSGSAVERHLSRHKPRGNSDKNGGSSSL